MRLRLSRYASDKIAIIYAGGDIYGKEDRVQIGSDDYRALIRKARTDKTVKAIVLRVNSPGGSSIASSHLESSALPQGENRLSFPWRLCGIRRYYISCDADGICATEYAHRIHRVFNVFEHAGIFQMTGREF
jgi:protease-4